MCLILLSWLLLHQGKNHLDVHDKCLNWLLPVPLKDVLVYCDKCNPIQVHYPTPQKNLFPSPSSTLLSPDRITFQTAQMISFCANRSAVMPISTNAERISQTRIAFTLAPVSFWTHSRISIAFFSFPQSSYLVNSKESVIALSLKQTMSSVRTWLSALLFADF